jgi:hypothetical protein
VSVSVDDAASGHLGLSHVEFLEMVDVCAPEIDSIEKPLIFNSRAGHQFEVKPTTQEGLWPTLDPSRPQPLGPST